MFWGLIMEPQRRYTQVAKKSFHISMAALDISTSSEESSQVMCGFEGRNYLMCTLKKPEVLQCPLNLTFKAGTEISFAANGKCHIHLTGYLVDEKPPVEDEDENLSEAPAQKPQKRKISDIRQTSEDSSIGDPKKSRTDDQESCGSGSRGSAYQDDTSQGSVSTGNGNNHDTIIEDDDEENDDDEDSNSLIEESEGEESEREDEDENEKGIEEENENGIEEEESSLSEEESDSDTKSAARKLNGFGGPKGKTESEKKKVANTSKTSAHTKAEETKEAKKSKKKTLQGGLIVEDLKEGQGAFAKNGKVVHVYYVGRLKQNNNVFDSNTKGAGFSFKIGRGAVIKGWEVGVQGMKVGGKRRLTCPPAMGYGKKGSPPIIPPNSTLIFDIELKKVQ